MGSAYEKNRTAATDQSRLNDAPYGLYLAGSALLTVAITVFFFSPPFAAWRKLNLPTASKWSETSRAVDVLRQLNDPWTPASRDTHRVIEWRLFFPLLGYYLSLPPTLFLALPLVGCLAASALIAHVMNRELKNRYAAFYSTVLAAGCAWFFVSTGWLSYNDSWIILGLTVVTFVRSPLACLATSLCCPWIDERLVLMLPTCLGVRFFLDEQPPRLAAMFKLSAICLLGVAPYLLIRAAAYAQGVDPVTDVYVGAAAKYWPTPWQILEGSWAGLRCLWLYAAAFCYLAPRRRPQQWTAVFLPIAVATYALSLFIAADLGRSISCFLPVGLAGVALLHRQPARWPVHWLQWVMIVNLLLPAWHVVTTFRTPIYYLYVQLGQLKQPVTDDSAERYNAQGMALLESHQIDQAIEAFDMALGVQPDHAAALFNRASANATRGRFEEARKDLTRVIQQGVDLPNAHFLRGFCNEMLGDRAAAAADYQAALRLAPPDWPVRSEAAQRLESFQKQ